VNRFSYSNSCFVNRKETQGKHKALLGTAVFIVTLSLLFVACAPNDQNRELRIAVASNFKAPAAELVKRFQERTGRLVTITLGSTGKLYAQIDNGAPFDVFLAADEERPRLLEDKLKAAKGTRFTYAVGRLALWSPKENFVDPEGKVLESGAFTRLAIANPSLAPYGKAAEEVLRKRGLWEKISDKLVRGENIGQTFQFVSSGNAELGFVALSQVAGKGGSFWEVPQELYTPIQQQAVLLKEEEGARAFLEFLKSDEAQAIMEKYGYSKR
jgi:molybdate transport system substrate-binding protein